MTAEEGLALLSDASKGLLYPSESDEPFLSFLWTRAVDESALDAVRRNTQVAGAATTETTDKFFEELQESDDQKRFAVLRKKLNAVVDNAVVVRIGEINIDIFLFGERGGKWIGLRTRSIET